MSAPLKIWFERERRLLRLRLDRPKANILDAAMNAAIEEALAEHAVAPELRAILIDASGTHFSFGASIEEHMPDKCAAMLEGFHRLILKVLSFEVPILAVVRGQCLGGGLELVSAAHLIFASQDAKFGQPEIQIGVIAPAASCLLPERVSLAAAEDLLISGRSIDAQEALRIGLVNAVADDPEAEALAYFDKHLAPKSAKSLRYAVRAARCDAVDRIANKLKKIEKLYLDELMATADAVEGLTAFIEKRPARWKDA